MFRFETAGAVEAYRDGGVLEAKSPDALLSPGMGLPHYAPRARLVLIESELAELGARLAGAVEDLPEDQVGVMLPAEVAAPAGVAVVFRWGRWAAPEEMARVCIRVAGAGRRGLHGDFVPAAAGRGDWRGDPGPAAKGRDQGLGNRE